MDPSPVQAMSIQYCNELTTDTGDSTFGYAVMPSFTGITGLSPTTEGRTLAYACSCKHKERIRPIRDDGVGDIRVRWPPPSSHVGFSYASLRLSWHCLPAWVDRRSKLSKAAKTRSNSMVRSPSRMRWAVILLCGLDPERLCRNWISVDNATMTAADRPGGQQPRGAVELSHGSRSVLGIRVPIISYATISGSGVPELVYDLGQFGHARCTPKLVRLFAAASVPSGTRTSGLSM